MSKTYVPLHCHTTYSKLDGACKIPELAQRAADLNLPGISINDHGTLSGWIEFYKECVKSNVKPLQGIELYFADDRFTKADVEIKDSHGEISGTKHYYHLTAIAADLNGYHNLIEMSTDSFVNGLHRRPRTDWEFLESHSKGVMFGTGCLGSPVQQALLHDNYRLALETAARLKDIADEGFLFVELMNHLLPEQTKVNPLLLRLADDLNLPVVATTDLHYIDRASSIGHEVLLCCGTGTKLSDEKRFKFPNDEFYLKSYDEMFSLFPHNPEFLSNTLVVAEKCNVSIDFETQHLPQFDVPAGFVDDKAYLRHLVFEGLVDRFGVLSDEVVERAEYELGVIGDMGVSSYFLIVWDLVSAAREMGIQTSPGRGSSSGSVCMFTLKATQADPLKFDLPIERFLNPARVFKGSTEYDLPALGEAVGRRDSLTLFGKDARIIV